MTLDVLDPQPLLPSAPLEPLYEFGFLVPNQREAIIANLTRLYDHCRGLEYTPASSSSRV